MLQFNILFSLPVNFERLLTILYLFIEDVLFFYFRQTTKINDLKVLTFMYILFDLYFLKEIGSFFCSNETFFRLEYASGFIKIIFKFIYFYILPWGYLESSNTFIDRTY